jgi:predicted DNA-binding transcriptional regulator AlpA
MTMSFTPLSVQEEFTKELSNQIIKSLSESGIIKQNGLSESSEDQWLNIEELCKYLPDHPCKNTIYKWKRKGIIPFHKRSKHLYFLRSEIDAWLKSKRGLTNDEISSKIDKIIPGKPFGRTSK